jgi:hypothetical protein
MNDIHEKLESLTREVKIISEYMKRNFASLNANQLEKYGMLLTYLRYLEESINDIRKSLDI